MSDMPPGYDHWKLMSPEDERDRHVRSRRRLIGRCDCCDAKGVPLQRAWVTGIETFACAACCGDDT